MEKVFHAYQGGLKHESGPDCGRNRAFEADRGHYLDGGLLYQCLRKNGRFFDVPAWVIFECRTADGDRADGDRCFSGVHGRRNQDDDCVCAISGH